MPKKRFPIEVIIRPESPEFTEGLASSIARYLDEEDWTEAVAVATLGEEEALHTIEANFTLLPSADSTIVEIALTRWGMLHQEEIAELEILGLPNKGGKQPLSAPVQLVFGSNSSSAGPAATGSTLTQRQASGCDGKKQEVMDRDGAWCIWCSQPLTCGNSSIRKLVHSHRGSDHTENRVVSCRICARNRSKQRIGVWYLEATRRALRPREDLLEKRLTLIEQASPFSELLVGIERKIMRGEIDPHQITAHMKEARASHRCERFAELELRDGAGCIWCGKSFSENTDYPTFDHIIPRSCRGPNQMDNYLQSCSPCNHQRGCKGALEWGYGLFQAGYPVRIDKVVVALEKLAERDDIIADFARVELEAQLPYFEQMQIA